MNVMTVGFESEAAVNIFLTFTDLREFGLRSIGDRIYLDVYDYDEKKLIEGITEFALKIYAVPAAEKYVDKTCGYFSEHEKNKILRTAISGSFLREIFPKVVDVTQTCMKENNGLLDVEGYVRFRLKWLTEIFFRRIDVFAEETIAKREYDELVQILRHVLRRSEKRGGVIIDFADNNCRVTDLKGEELESAKTGENLAETDMFVGILAKMAPKKIIIRNAQSADEMLITVIRDVFEDSVFIE